MSALMFSDERGGGGGELEAGDGGAEAGSEGSLDLLHQGLDDVVGRGSGGGGACGQIELLCAVFKILGPDVARRVCEEVRMKK
mmetsp:Transcript_47773/g.99967  ORF Transcript_47773/g.99967 Transcript_47773/m.99967 type:complete len:83 (-) Transcript_47773:642-890(-)